MQYYHIHSQYSKQPAEKQVEFWKYHMIKTTDCKTDGGRNIHKNVYYFFLPCAIMNKIMPKAKESLEWDC